MTDLFTSRCGRPFFGSIGLRFAVLLSPAQVMNMVVFCRVGQGATATQTHHTHAYKLSPEGATFQVCSWWVRVAALLDPPYKEVHYSRRTQ